MSYRQHQALTTPQRRLGKLLGTFVVLALIVGGSAPYLILPGAGGASVSPDFQVVLRKGLAANDPTTWTNLTSTETILNGTSGLDNFGLKIIAIAVSLGGFNGSIFLRVVGLPVGITSVFQPSVLMAVADGFAASALTLTAAANVTSQQAPYNVTVIATSSSPAITHSASFSLRARSTKLFWSPSVLSVNKGQRFTLSLDVSDVFNVSGFQFSAHFNSTLITALTNGTIFNPDFSRYGYIVRNPAGCSWADNSTGTIGPPSCPVAAFVIGQCSSSPCITVTGSETYNLLTQTFVANTNYNGTSPVTLDNDIIAEQIGQTLFPDPHHTLGGIVTIGETGHAAPPYLTGVNAGAKAIYADASGSWSLPGPPQPPFSRFINLNFTELDVTRANGNNVTALQEWVYYNQTARTSIIDGSVATNSGNITFWFIAANLTAGDPVYMTPNAPVINQTFTGTFAGASRTINVFNSTQPIPGGGFSSIKALWDQKTGVLLRIDIASSISTPTGPIGSAFLTASLVKTNLWNVTDKPPVANFFYAPQSVQTGHSVFFNGSSSMDPDGFIINYSWNFGDGTLGFGEFPSHVYNNPGSYTVTLTVTDNSGLTGTTSQSVFVVQPLAHDVGIVSINPEPKAAVSGQTVDVGIGLANSGQQAETVDLTVYYDSHVAVTVHGITVPVTSAGTIIVGNSTTIPPQQFSYFVLVLWDTSGVVAGNYTISATVFLATDQNLANNHLTDGQVSIMPPPVLTLTPASGSLGDKVLVHGSGFPVSSFPSSLSSPLTVEVTFDDQLLGFTTTSNGTFDFVFDVPHAQVGSHEVHAIAEEFPLPIGATASFTVLPEPKTGGLTVSISVGTVYFPGDTASIFVLATLNGSPTQPATIHLMLVFPNGTVSNLSLQAITPGFSEGSYTVPAKGSIGTYGLVVTVQQNSLNASGLGSFEVKPSWLQTNGHTILMGTSITGAVGAIGVLAMAWRGGHLAKRRRDNELYESS